MFRFYFLLFWAAAAFTWTFVYYAGVQKKSHKAEEQMVREYGPRFYSPVVQIQSGSIGVDLELQVGSLLVDEQLASVVDAVRLQDNKETNATVVHDILSDVLIKETTYTLSCDVHAELDGVYGSARIGAHGFILDAETQLGIRTDVCEILMGPAFQTTKDTRIVEASCKSDPDFAGFTCVLRENGIMYRNRPCITWAMLRQHEALLNCSQTHPCFQPSRLYIDSPVRWNGTLSPTSTFQTAFVDSQEVSVPLLNHTQTALNNENITGWDAVLIFEFAVSVVEFGVPDTFVAILSVGDYRLLNPVHVQDYYRFKSDTHRIVYISLPIQEQPGGMNVNFSIHNLFVEDYIRLVSFDMRPCSASCPCTYEQHDVEKIIIPPTPPPKCQVVASFSSLEVFLFKGRGNYTVAVPVFEDNPVMPAFNQSYLFMGTIIETDTHVTTKLDTNGLEPSIVAISNIPLTTPIDTQKQRLFLTNEGVGDIWDSIVLQLRIDATSEYKALNENWWSTFELTRVVVSFVGGPNGCTMPPGLGQENQLLVNQTLVDGCWAPSMPATSIHMDFRANMSHFCGAASYQFFSFRALSPVTNYALTGVFQAHATANKTKFICSETIEDSWEHRLMTYGLRTNTVTRSTVFDGQLKWTSMLCNVGWTVDPSVSIYAKNESVINECVSITSVPSTYPCSPIHLFDTVQTSPDTHVDSTEVKVSVLESLPNTTYDIILPLTAKLHSSRSDDVFLTHWIDGRKADSLVLYGSNDDEIVLDPATVSGTITGISIDSVSTSFDSSRQNGLLRAVFNVPEFKARWISTYYSNINCDPSVSLLQSQRQFVLYYATTPECPSFLSSDVSSPYSVAEGSDRPAVSVSPNNENITVVYKTGFPCNLKYVHQPPYLTSQLTMTARCNYDRNKFVPLLMLQDYSVRNSMTAFMYYRSTGGSLSAEGWQQRVNIFVTVPIPRRSVPWIEQHFALKEVILSCNEVEYFENDIKYCNQPWHNGCDDPKKPGNAYLNQMPPAGHPYSFSVAVPGACPTRFYVRVLVQIFNQYNALVHYDGLHARNFVPALLDSFQTVDFPDFELTVQLARNDSVVLPANPLVGNDPAATKMRAYSGDFRDASKTGDIVNWPYRSCCAMPVCR